MAKKKRKNSPKDNFNKEEIYSTNTEEILKEQIKKDDKEKLEKMIEELNHNDKKENKKKVISKKIIIPFIILALLSFIGYVSIEILKNESLINSFNTLISITIIFLFIICFTVIGFKSNNRKTIPVVIIGTLLIIFYSTFNILNKLNIINLPKENYVLNFYNTPLSDIYKFKETNNIDIIEVYEYSDTIPEYHIISQDVTPYTLVKNINKITVIISKGPDFNKEIVVPSFTGMKYDDVIKYLEENYLNNVEISFENSNNPIDTVIYQEGSGTRRRNDLIKLTFSKGEIVPINIIDFTNQSLLSATSWLTKNGFKYELIYEYSENINKNYIISQNTVNEVKNPETDVITLTVSKGKTIKVPDLTKMSVEEINKWIMENGLKVTYSESYNETISLGNIISANVKTDDIIETGSEIEIVISKGRLEMPKVESISEFTIWANTNNVNYDIISEYSTTILKDEIIKTSHQTGDVIKKDDTVIITISKGKSVTIPSFIGQGKSAIQNKCTSLNLNCSFTYGGYTENTKRDIALKQSKASGTIVSEGTNLVITLSSGVYEKVTIPNFSGKTKSSISSTCNSLGIKCNFTYQSSFSSTAKDICVGQSKTGKVNKGTTITITLSKGPAATYKVVIDANQLSNGNPSATKNTLQQKLTSACPGVTFVFKFEKANSGIGYLAPNSQVKVGSNTFTQGKTYTVIINSN